MMEPTLDAAAPPPPTTLVASVNDGAARHVEGDALYSVDSEAVTAVAQRGRSFLTHQQRLAIIQKKEEEPRWTQTQLARWAGAHFKLGKEPSQATIAMLLKQRDRLKAATVRPQTRTIRRPKHPELEDALLLWVRYLQSKRVPFTGENIRLKAAALATQMGIKTSMNFSTGWMTGFVERHSLVLARAHKKKHNSESEDEPMRSRLCSFEARDIFAMDESSLIYNDLPFGHDHQDHANPDRDRICVGLAVNMDSSEKLEPLVVTTTRRKLDVLSETYYDVDGNMTARIFDQWLYKMNQRMASAQRKIVFLVDSAPSHFPIELSHIKLVRLPPKGLHRSQPFEAGVMKTFKALYRKSHLSFAVDQAEEGRTRIFDVSLTRALHWVKQAWLDVSADLIRNCWARTGLFTTRDQILTTEAADIHPEVVQSLVVSLSQLQLLETVPIETLLNPRNEDDAHYVYDDTTVLRVVTGSLADDEEGARMEIVHAAAPACDPSAGAVSTQREEERVVDTPPSEEELLANYRGVIWSLDADPNRSEEATSVLKKSCLFKNGNE